jgi:hypothetical protein
LLLLKLEMAVVAAAIRAAGTDVAHLMPRLRFPASSRRRQTLMAPFLEPLWELPEAP